MLCQCVCFSYRYRVCDLPCKYSVIFPNNKVFHAISILSLRSMNLCVVLFWLSNISPHGV